MAGSAAQNEVETPQEGDPNYVPPAPVAESIAGDAAKGAATGSVAGPIGTAIGAIVGAGLGIWGAITGANDQAAIDNEKAALERAEAGEVARREAANDTVAQQTIFRQKLDISSEMAGAGHEGGSIGSQLEVARQGNLQIQLNDEAAKFQEGQILAGARMQSQLGSQTLEAGAIKAAGYGVTAVTGFGRYAAPSLFTSPQRLPQPGEGY